ncbi:hypothetical protein H4582DRAFT_2071684 [Lactarius indigo]|nr:hypothetical protein H4582DRAFT_2071684 [Lactarius indigo]
MSLNLNRILPLPDELISYILEQTDSKAVIACRRSCRRLKDIVDDSSALQYLVELSAARMCDGAPSAVGHAERLTRLQKAQAAWRSSSWSPVDHFPYSKEMSPFPVTASGNLVAFRSDRSRMGELLMLRFPSDLRGIPEQLWYLDLDCDRSLHPVGTSFLVHITSTFAHSPPEESTPLTSTSGTIRSHSDYEAFDLHIHGDLLSFVGASHILVWNWKTGDRLAEIASVSPSCPFSKDAVFADSFSAFNHQRAVLRLPRRQAHRLYALQPHAGAAHRSASKVTTLPESDNTGPFGAELLSLRAGPTDALPTVLHRAAREHAAAAPGGRVGAITVEGFTAVFTLHTLYVPHDAFLSYIAAHPAPPPPQQPGDPIPIDVPWEAWGPGNTRLVTVPNVAHSRYLGLYKVCGMHALSEPPILIDDGILCIMDYLPSRAPPPAELGDGSVRGEQADSMLVSPNDSATEEPRASGSSGDGAIAAHQELPRVPPPPTPPDTSIPYSIKGIPLPEGLESDSVRCVLCEDVVVLFEVGTIYHLS